MTSQKIIGGVRCLAGEVGADAENHGEVHGHDREVERAHDQSGSRLVSTRKGLRFVAGPGTTAEGTCHAEKELPHPHPPVALGFSNVKPLAVMFET